MKKKIAFSKPLRLKESNKLWNETINFIPGGAQTFSKMPFQHGDGVAPKFIKKSKGCFSWDIDDNKYIDFMCSLGPIILGYCDKEVNKSAIQMINQGSLIPSLPNTIETELSKTLVSLIPSAEMVRFGKNGSDVTHAAVRAARGLTKRDIIAVCGYHGWHDWYIGTTSRDLGVPNNVKELTHKFFYNDIDSLDKLFKKNKSKIAAVIMEPLTFYEPENDFLHKVKEIAHSNGALLIFDEVISGFRSNLGGAQKLYDVTPDFTCLGKAMANGFPLSAIVGKKKYMEIFNEIFFSFTFGGEVPSIAASLTTIKLIKKRKTISKINNLGNKLISGYNNIVKKLKLNRYTKMIGFGWWPEYLFFLEGKPSLKLQTFFQQEIVRRGILSRNGMFLCGEHNEKIINKTLNIFEESLFLLKKTISEGNLDEKIQSKLIEPVIRDS